MNRERKFTSTAYRIALVEDSGMLRGLLSALIDELDGTQPARVVLEAESEDAALRGMKISRVDLAIVDLQLRQGSGWGVLEQVSRRPEQYGSPKMVILSNHVLLAMNKRRESLGVDRIFDKTYQIPQLLTYIRYQISQRACDPGGAPPSGDGGIRKEM